VKNIKNKKLGQFVVRRKADAQQIENTCRNRKFVVRLGQRTAN
jgi:hypothetical protein